MAAEWLPIAGILDAGGDDVKRPYTSIRADVPIRRDESIVLSSAPFGGWDGRCPRIFTQSSVASVQLYLLRRTTGSDDEQAS
jgi:hypothetical protein